MRSNSFCSAAATRESVYHLWLIAWVRLWEVAMEGKGKEGWGSGEDHDSRKVTDCATSTDHYLYVLFHIEKWMVFDPVIDKKLQLQGAVDKVYQNVIHDRKHHANLFRSCFFFTWPKKEQVWCECHQRAYEAVKWGLRWKNIKSCWNLQAGQTIFS